MNGDLKLNSTQQCLPKLRWWDQVEDFFFSLTSAIMKDYVES